MSYLSVGYYLPYYVDHSVSIMYITVYVYNADHNYLMTKIRTVKCVNIDTCSTVVTKTFYRWSEDYTMQYKDTINSADIQSSFLEIVDEAGAIVEPSNIDATVGKINNPIMEAAEPCKVTSRQ